MKKTINFAAGVVIGSLIAGSAMADRLSIGAGVLATPDLYKSSKIKYYAIPIINYENEFFYIRDLEAGYYLWNDGANKIAATLSYSPLRFDPGDAHSQALSQLNKRRASAFGGLSYQHVADWGILAANIEADILNNSRGLTSEFNYAYRFRMDKLSLTPSVGIGWADQRFNRYYYGISRSEAARSGLSYYNPGSSWSPYMQFSANYLIGAGFGVHAAARYTRLSSEITDSQMVKQNYSVAYLAGITYSF